MINPICWQHISAKDGRVFGIWRHGYISPAWVKSSQEIIRAMYEVSNHQAHNNSLQSYI